MAAGDVRAQVQRLVGPPSSTPWITGSNGPGSIGAPASAAIAWAAMSACCAAIPPCLIGEIGRVAGGIDAVDARHLAVDVDRDEPGAGCSGNTGHRGAEQLAAARPPGRRAGAAHAGWIDDATRLGRLAVSGR